MIRTHSLGLAAIVIFAIAEVNLGCAQNFPNRPIRIVTSEIGGNLDTAARLIAPALSANLGQQVIVDNRPATVIPTETVAKALPDGYTLLFMGSPVWLMSFMRDNVSWDPFKDFAPVGLVVSSPNILVVNPSLPVKSVKELIALAKAKPGELNDAGGGVGSSTHMAGELFKVMAGVKIVRINYRGGGPAIIALLGNQAQLMFSPAASASPHVKSGKLRALAVTSAEPTNLFPGIPTVAAAGDLPGYEAVTRIGMFAPAKTSDLIAARLNQEIVRVLNQPDIKEKLGFAGIEPVGGSKDQLVTTMKSERASLGKVITDVGIRVE